jgi:hypothetical protein
MLITRWLGNRPPGNGLVVRAVEEADVDEPGGAQEQVRPEVVDTIFGVLKGDDPAALPPSATKAEKDAAKDRYLSEVLAERSKRDRQAQAWELLLTRSYDEPPTWERIFDDLPAGSRQQLGELYDALPAGAQEEYARRYGAPSTV